MFDIECSLLSVLIELRNKIVQFTAAMISTLLCFYVVLTYILENSNTESLIIVERWHSPSISLTFIPAIGVQLVRSAAMVAYVQR